MQVETKIFDDPRALAAAAAERWLALYQESVTEHGVFHVALAGGSTPRQLYQLLSQPDFSEKMEWRHIHLFFGDERAVPGDHPDSNFRMARETLLDHIPIPHSNIHRIETECGSIQEAADRYEKVLLETVSKTEDGVPQFDLILLGIGPDGHTASLFPGTDILQQNERYVDAVYVEQKSTWRVSLTFPVINHARHILFLVAGADKQPVVQQILSDTHSEPLFPVQMLNPLGQVEMYLDLDAADQTTAETGNS